MRINSAFLASFISATTAVLACGNAGPTADELNKNRGGASNSTGGNAGGTTAVSGGADPLGSGGSLMTSGGSTTVTSGGAITAAGGSATLGGGPASSSGGSDASMGGSMAGSTSGSMGGSMQPSSGGAALGSGGAAAGSSSGGGTSVAMGGAGGSGGGSGPYAPRTGSFKMLVYSITKGFAHDSIPLGQKMLQDIAVKQGFELTIATDNRDITPTGLAQYEMVFFMNSTGNIFNDTEQKAYEDWIKNNGAFAGTHSATDTEEGWAFYKEITGQYYDLHDPCCAQANIQWQADATNFVAVKGLPSPWPRSEEWYKFNQYQAWSTKSGFKILSMVTTTGGGTRPVSYTREWGNFRAFYTSLGHVGSTFQDANVIKHVTAGLMWAVRREALIKP